jgi:hypothetical protein
VCELCSYRRSERETQTGDVGRFSSRLDSHLSLAATSSSLAEVDKSSPTPDLRPGFRDWSVVTFRASQGTTDCRYRYSAMKGARLAMTRQKRGCHLLSRCDHFERKLTQQRIKLLQNRLVGQVTRHIRKDWPTFWGLIRAGRVTRRLIAQQDHPAKVHTIVQARTQPFSNLTRGCGRPV